MRYMNRFKGPIGMLVCSMALLFGSAGCSLTESRCETVDDWSRQCGNGAISVDECIGAYEDSSSMCQNAFDNFADCLDTDDSCYADESDCVSEAQDFLNYCA